VRGLQYIEKNVSEAGNWIIERPSRSSLRHSQGNCCCDNLNGAASPIWSICCCSLCICSYLSERDAAHENSAAGFSEILKLFIFLDSWRLCVSFTYEYKFICAPAALLMECAFGAFEWAHVEDIPKQALARISTNILQGEKKSLPFFALFQDQILQAWRCAISGAIIFAQIWQLINVVETFGLR